MIEAAPLSAWSIAIVFGLAGALSPWAALLGLALLSHLPWGAAPPGDLAAFGSPLLAVPAAALLCLELAVRRRALLGTASEVIHVPVRMLLPPLLLILAVGSDWTLALAAAAGLATATAAYATFFRWGFELRSEALGTIPPHWTWLGELGLVLGAAAFAAGAAWAPFPHAGAAAAVLAAATVTARPALRAAPLAPRLVLDAALHFAGEGGWREGRRLPRWLRKQAPLRATPALLHGSAPGQGTRAGWLAIQEDGPSFLFRSPARVWSVPLEAADSPRADRPRGGLLVPISLRLGDDDIVLATSRGGPTSGEVRRALGGEARAQDL